MSSFKYFFLFFVGGIAYYLIEIIYRGISHPAMMALGGACFVLIAVINNRFRFLPVIIRLILSTVIITALEFIAGCILNLWLGLGIWSYSNMPFNVLGQICPLYMGFWFLLSAVAFLLHNKMEQRFFVNLNDE